MNRASLLFCLATLSAHLAWQPPAVAQILASDASDVVEVTLLPGWREPDGTHMAALRIKLAPGWKTFWRAPGDGGVPTRLDFSGSTNLRGSHVIWPTPEVFRQNGMRTVGYRDEVVVPLAFHAAHDGPIALSGVLDFGVCAEVCLPVHLTLDHVLAPLDQANVEVISAAMGSGPISADAAQVGDVTCKLTHGNEASSMEVSITMPKPDGQNEALVIEPSEAHVWVSEPVLQRHGDVLTARAEVASSAGGDVAMDLGRARLTVLTTRTGVDIGGCR